MMRGSKGHWWLLVVALGSLCPAILWASSVDPSNIIPIERVLQDEDGDDIPDRLGQTVTVTGWVSADSHSFRNDQFDVFIQEDTGGLLLRGPASLKRLGEGQRLIVSGVLLQEEGFTYLGDVELRILPRQLRLLRPLEITYSENKKMLPTGKLVVVKGEIKSILEEVDGTRIVLRVGAGVSDLMVVFWPSNHRERLNTSSYRQGDRLEVSGVIARQGGKAPFEDYMEIWPRSQGDVQMVGFSKQSYLKAWIGLACALLVILLYGVSLKNQVKRKTADLREIQEKFQTIYESAADGIFIIDVAGKIRSANPAAEEITGYTSSEIRSREFISLLPNLPTSRWAKIVQEVSHGKGMAMDVLVARHAGENMAVEMKTSAVELSGKPFYMVMMRDITKRKKAEQQLAEEKERLSVTVESIADGVVTTDREGRITSFNHAAEKLCKINEKLAVKKNLTDVLRLGLRSNEAASLDPVETVMTGHRQVELPLDTILMQPGGAEIPVSVVCAPLLNSSQKISGVVIAFADVSHRVHAEAELQKATKLESIGTLAGGIAHDFNNIMTSVIGNLSLATTFLDEQQTEEVRACMEHAQRSSQRAKSLTSQLLTFSSGGDPVKRTAHLQEVLKDAVDFGLSGSSIRVEQDFEENLWAVNVDTQQIIHALSNILINAKEEVGSTGSITLTAKNKRVDTKDGTEPVGLGPGRYVQITLTDNGGGIPMQILDKIFDPYFTTKEKGSGLGLAATYSIVKMHGGVLDVDSTPGFGTSFIMYLPACDRIIEKVIKPKRKLALGTGRILIMDDEKSIRRVASFMLKKMGFEPVTAVCGEEALEMYSTAKEEGCPFDAVLMDLTIPGGMGGEETIKNLLKFDPDVKAIVSSGYSTDPIMAQHEKYGFVGVVAKPYNLQQLGAALEDALQMKAKIPAG